MTRVCVWGIATVLVGVSSASATTINAAMTVDDAFTAYTSTSDSVAGTSFLSGPYWPTTYLGSATLSTGVTNYLHIYGEDVYGVISAFIGQFTLSDGAFRFANGTDTLLTNVSEWVVSATGFGSGYVTPTDFGGNGIGPWGLRTGVSAAARWIWRTPSPSSPACFSVPIYWVPEPNALVLLFVGAMVVRRR